MSSTATTNSRFSGTAWLLGISVAAPLVTCIFLLALSVSYGWILLAGLTLPFLLWLALRHPDSIVALTALLIFANAPTVAHKFHGLPKVMAMLGPAAALGGVFFYQLVICREPLVFPRASKWIAAFLGVEIVSAAICRHPEIAMDILKVDLLEGVGLFFIVCNVIRTRACLRQVVVALLLAGAFLGSLSLWQQVTHTHRNDYGGFAQVPIESKGFRTEDNQLQHRAAGPVGEKNRYAQTMLLLIPLAVLPLYSTQNFWHKAGYILAALLIGAGCLLTFSRGAAVAFVILILAMKLAGYIRTKHLIWLAAAGVLSLALFPQLSNRLDSVRDLVARLAGQKAAQTEDVDTAITGRATSMLAALRVTADYPLVGVGPGNFPLLNREYAKVGGFKMQQEDREAHNLYLHLSAETGVTGLCLFLAMIAVTITDLHRLWKANQQRDPELAGFAASFIMVILAYLLTGLFLHFSFVRYFWLFFALACSLPAIAARESVNHQDQQSLGLSG